MSFPPLSRSYPNINEPATQLQLLNFNDKLGLDKVHMSARYESYSFKGVLEMSDDTNSVWNYVTGLNNFNTQHRDVDIPYINHLLTLFNLTHHQKKWINSLSNGQMRRARIAKSLMSKPRLLIIDDPFLGLDPSNTEKVSQALSNVHENLGTSMILGLRPQDDVPKWIQNIVFVDEEGISLIGPLAEVSNKLNDIINSDVDLNLDKKKLKTNSLVKIDPESVAEPEELIHI